MTEPAPLDPTRFLTTLPRWDQAAFFDALTLAPGALAALRVVPRESAARGAAVTEAIGAEIARTWPHVLRALAAWPDATAQRGGWDWLWMYVPAIEPVVLGQRLATELPPRGEAKLMGMLVVRQVEAAGNGAAQAAVRAVEDELERWHHGKPAIERRWVVAG